MKTLVDDPKSATSSSTSRNDADAEQSVDTDLHAAEPLTPVDLLKALHAADHGPGPGPERVVTALASMRAHAPRRSRARRPSAAEALLEEATPPITALPGGRASVPRRERETQVARSRRRVSEIAFTRVADAAAVFAAPLAAGYVTRSVGLFVAGAGIVALARNRARGMALGERAIGLISPIVTTLAIALIASADAAVTTDATRTHVLEGAGAALAISTAVAIVCTLVSRRLVCTRIAVIGSLAAAHELAWELTNDHEHRYTVVGFIAQPGEHDSMHDLRHVSFKVRPLGPLEELEGIVEHNDIDMLVLANGADRLQVFERAAACAERRRTRLVSLGTFNENVFQRVSIEELNSAWLQHMMHPRYRPAPAALIRLFDVAGALVLGLLTTPLWLAAAVAVRMEDRGPIFYRQQRVGARCRNFTIIKFRSMRTDAEASGPRWSSGNSDDRVTRVGRLIRRFHVDELPQLINVLKGDMSLVGPRPERPEFVHRLEKEIPFYGRRHLIKPGVTGWAQVRAGYGMSDDGQVVKLSRDLFYLKHQSILLYLYILVATAFTVVAGTVHSRAH